MAAWAGLSGKVYALIAGTAVAAGGGASLIIKNDEGQPIIQSLLSQPPAQQAEPESDEPVQAEKQEEVASLPPETAEQPVEPEIAEPKLPVFDILRVEKDGSVVIAGNGPSNSEIEILADGDVLATGKSGPDGDFAIVFDDPLKPGSHELFIRATPEGADPVMSAEAGIVTIPEPDDADGEVLAMVQESGEATRILQAPMQDEASPEPEETEQQPEEITRQPESETEQPVGEAETRPVEEAGEAGETEVAVAEEPEKPAEAAKPVEKPEAPTRVQAVDVEPDRLFVAGRGEANRRARIYINGEFKGETVIGPEGAFLFDLGEKLEPGKYDFRVDVLDGSAADVASRASVTVDHAPEPVQVAEASSEPEVQAPKEPVEAEQVPEEPAGVEQTQAETGQMETATDEPVEETQVVETEAEAPAQVAVVEQSAETETPTVAEPDEAEPAKPVIRTGRSVIIRRGDNLWRISRRMLGAGRKYTLIFSANANKIEDPDWIYPGQVFDVPDAEEETAETVDSQNG